MAHSEKLEETALWKVYQEKAASDGKRSQWVKEVYEAAANYMADVRRTFENYTLHDETHILNVLDAMSGLLGDQITKLTVGEVELLILAACLHDLGMVYTEEEKQQCYGDEAACRKFLKEYCPELLGYAAEDWPEDTRKWYLRTLHPFRLQKVLQNEPWKELFDKCPLDTVPKRCMIAVCQAHGEDPAKLLNHPDLNYLAANDAEPLFCALLLRLGDLLDFDDTRAPQILYGYVKCNEESRAEWDKHQASAGFRYPFSPSADDLPYKARCTDPGVEHAIRDFLDWIDEELGNCVKLQKHCRTAWQQEFPFPRAVLRDEIESDGYMSGDFCLTMDQTQILNLLTGENLYDSTDVFIRELLQNAIDATLLRGEMEHDFIPEQARIDLWEWNDGEGNIWFRIDDQGTGMTLGMLQRYFLKVGNSYYNSREMERDLRDHGRTKKYNGISRFGIGFLSSFLCGDYAEVSTLYFDSDKNRREEASADSYQTLHYGLRLQITGLSGYYTLKNQSKHHPSGGYLPAPADYVTRVQNDYERDGYRAAPGTSIVIRLDPGKLGALNFRKAAEGYLCGSRVPVYYNNKRIGQTYEELMQEAHEAAGEKIYEIPSAMKEEFDRNFPAVRGQYPKITVSVIPLDAEEDQVLPELSGVLVKYAVHFDSTPQWRVKDQIYRISGHADVHEETVEIVISSENKSRITRYGAEWGRLKHHYDLEVIAALAAEFERQPVCPGAEDIWDIWEPFSEWENLYEIWELYHNKQHERTIRFSVARSERPDMMPLSCDNRYGRTACVYQGIAAGDLSGYISPGGEQFAIFLLSGIWRPEVKMSRSAVSGLPLTILITINAIFSKYHIPEDSHMLVFNLDALRNYSISEWREANISRLHRWMSENQGAAFLRARQTLQKALNDSDTPVFSIFSYSEDAVMNKYIMTYFQDNYRMTINYEDGQIISFYKKGDGEMEDTFDLFPPMMFCKAASDRSRRYICSADEIIRRGITSDHPFAAWLLDNAVLLKRYYQRQFQQIIDCLCQASADYIIKECSKIREQLIALPKHHGVDAGSFPQLSMADFWSMEAEKGSEGTK